TATATDAAGNVTTSTGNITVDTELSVGFDDTQVGDNLITASEANAGIILTGTTQAGASVEITLNGVTRAATVSSDGTWTASFAASDLPSGVMELPMSATATDAAGNTATDTGTVSLDTLGFVAIGPDAVEGDNVINDVELSDGVVFTGSTQPGSLVNVTFAGETYAATVSASGTWTVGFPASDIPTGTYLATVSATAESPSGNLATTTAQVRVDTQVDGFTLTSGTVGGDGVLGASELGAGVTVTGTTEPGSTVLVTLGGVSTSAIVGNDGTWTATFASGTIPAGEYATQLVAQTTDAAGNVESITQNVSVDTVAGSLSLSGDAIEGDDIVNAAEEADGVSITGLADAGAVVEVTLGGVVKTVITGSDGTWSAYYSSGEIPDGTYTSAIQAVTVDGAGNIASVTDSVQVDTELTNFAFSTAPIEGDDRVTGLEAADGVTVTGTVEPGSTVSVKLGDETVQAIVSTSGTWTATFTADQIEAGEYTATFVATATDAAGNSSVITDTAQVDTAVTNLAITSLPVGDGQVLNAAAADDGITFGGTVEAGSTVYVTFEGVTRLATVSTSGAWTVSFDDSQIPVGEYTADVTVQATDAFGNTGTTTAQFDVDSQAPGAPIITAFSTGWTGLRGISTLLNDNDIEIAEITDQGAAQSLSYTTTEDTAYGELNINFTSPVSDGSDLVVTAEDDAG
ncbi:MAG: Ig-like domain-containing protein, partial [Pseudomonadota bacterium]